MADRTVSVRVRAVVGDFVAGMAQVGKSTREMSAGLAKAGKEHPKDLEKVSKAALLMGGAAAAGFGLAVKSAMDFDRGMSAVGAAAQASGKDLASLRSAALQAGKDTAFSATEAAQAEEALAKAGVSTGDILGGALNGALSLAAAGTLDLGTAAEDAASAMTMFQLHGRDVGHIADVLAAGAGKAQGEVGDLAQALNQTGLVAHQLGVSLDDTVGVLAEFAANGLQGSDAGTSFKTMLLALNPKSDEAAQLMKKLGLSFYDASGQFIGVTALAGQLHDKLGGLTQEQQNMALSTIFGSDAIRSASILMRDGAAGVQKWSDAVNDSGFAADVAKKKMDNLSGDLEQLRGSLETALIQGGSAATGVLRGLTQAATGAVNQFSDLPGPVQAAATAILGVSGGALLALGGLGTLIPKVREARSSLESMGTAGAKANKLLGALGKASAVGLGVIGLAEAVNALDKAVDGAFTHGVPSVNNLSTSLKRLATSGDLKSASLDAHHLAGAIDDLDYGTGVLDNLARGLADVGNGNILAAGNTFALGEAAKGSKKEIKNLDSAFAQLVQGGDVDAAQAAFATLQTQLEAQGVSAKEVTAAFPQYADALKGAKADADLTAAGMKGTASSIDGVTASAKGAADALADERTEAQRLRDELDGLNGKNIASTQGQIDYRNQVDTLNQSLKDNGATLDINTEKGRANMSQFLDTATAAGQYAQAVVDTTGDQASANKILSDARTQLYNVAIQSGLTKEAAHRLVDQYLAIPDEVSTAFRANTASAQGAIDRLNNSLNTLHDRTVTVNVRTLYSNPGTAVTPSSGRVGFASGGLIGGSGGPTSDTVPIMASPGEYMMDAATVDRYGVGFFDALNAGRIQKMAGGGLVRPAASYVTHNVTGGFSDNDLDRLVGALVSAYRLQPVQRVEITGSIKGRDLELAVRNAALRNRGRG